MKRNWLTYVAITASLIAGFICSTAFADNKGMKFSAGGFNAGAGRSFSNGGNINNVRNSLLPAGALHRNVQMPLQSQNFGGIQNQIKNHNLQQGISGRVSGIQLGNGGNNNNNGIGINRTPPIKINPGTIGGIVNGNGQGTGNGLGGIKLGNSGIK